MSFHASTIVDNCHDLAAERGNSVFAVQAKTQCFTAADAERTFHKYGRSTNCRDGSGGVWANDVYKIVPCRPGNVKDLSKLYTQILIRLGNNCLFKPCN